MATKQEIAIQRAVKKTKKQDKVREEKHGLWILIAIILLLLYLLFAQHFGWWPNARPKLGTAFYTNLSANVAKPSTASTDTSGTASTGSSTGTTGSGGTSSGGGTTTTGGDTGSGGSGGSGGTTTPADSSIVSFAGTVNVGDTKEKINGQATGLGQGCAVIAGADITQAGHQEVCTYTQGDKVVTVTYLNDKVVSASKTGF
jgi:cytoskeletal protein RodZ